MRFFRKIRTILLKWNEFVKRQLRKMGLFHRISIFYMLILATTFFITFFSYLQYTKEINLNMERYISLLVQNVKLKIQDTMGEYEQIALDFYEDNRVITALTENALLLEQTTGGIDNIQKQHMDKYEENTYLIESKLYHMSSNHKYIENIQFVTPTRQYHMVEENGYQRGGTIRDLSAFYKSDFYLKPQECYGYPVWIDGKEQSDIFFKNDQNVYGIPDIVTLAVSVYEPKSRDFLGVLLLNISMDAFSDSAQGYREYNDGNIFLIGEDGILTWFYPSITAPSFPAKEISFDSMLKNKRHIERLNIGDRKILLAYEQVSNTRIFCVFIADLSVLLGRSYRIRNLSIVVLLCMLVACFVISYYITLSIYHPVRDLIKIMKKTGDGRWNVRYENSGNDEITVLGDRFNEMADKTDQLIDEVYLSEIKRQKMLLNLKNAQLDAMLMQINPHFLYNTLDIIRWEAMYEANGESAVTQMIEKFSRLCRMGMHTDGNTITLRQGIEHASTYLEVVNFRHNDKIALETDIQVDMDTVYIPQFLLQPIMENAVVHAFGETSKGCRISIQSSAKEGILHIVVCDNGKGMTEEELDCLQRSLEGTEEKGKSIGLINIHQRIRLFYGEVYGIGIRSHTGQGSEIEITMPVRNYSENMVMHKGE